MLILKSWLIEARMWLIMRQEENRVFKNMPNFTINGDII